MSEEERLKRKNLLMSYYNQTSSATYEEPINQIHKNVNQIEFTLNSAANSSDRQFNQKNPYDINTSNFEFELFLKKLIKVK
jgi:hypothetical protein